MGMHIVVRSVTGVDYCIEVGVDWKVETLQREAEDVLDIGADEITLVVEGEKLENPEEPVSNFLREDSIVEVVQSAKDIAQKQLLQLGISLSVKQLMNAVRYGNSQAIRLLVSAGIDVNSLYEPPGSSCQQKTALMLAAQEQQLETVKILLELGAEPNISTSPLGETALDLAIASPEVTRLLLEHGADCTHRDAYGMIPLMYAVMNGHIETAKILLEGGSDINEADNEGITALIHASEVGNFEEVKFLTDNNADVNKRDDEGITSLMRAAKNNGRKIVSHLLKCNADPNAEDNYGKNALIYAVNEPTVDMEIVRLLKAAGSNVNAREHVTGTTSLMYAVHHGHIKAVEYLRQSGSDVNARDKLHGKPPIMFAQPFYFEAMRHALGLAEC
eukprot:TRINITY_DN1241_c1_g1_i1.p1 TRINITY_DN1241_c1_g1~~TRINITY_DN1241_c1_g1_i1.p1  ORF type:complete len:389 (+),score=70.32 TRINITY_DN1241_c1_g1_i1:52-1218(+)